MAAVGSKAAVRGHCPEAVAAMLPPILESYSRKYPRVNLQLDQVSTATLELPSLRERKVDLVVARLLPRVDDGHADDLNVEVLFNDHLVIAAGIHSRWARRRKIDLAVSWSTNPGSWLLPIPDLTGLCRKHSERVDYVHPESA